LLQILRFVSASAAFRQQSARNRCRTDASEPISMLAASDWAPAAARVLSPPEGVVSTGVMTQD
jgi:hypothetical protein